jgi:MerR family copper efflux transcriptional regulator
MSREGLTIAEAAKSLGVSTRTVRRFIKAGKIQADLVEGPFGQEYRITHLPTDRRATKPLDSTPGQSAGQAPAQVSVQGYVQVMDIVRELQDKNLALAAQQGAATERIRNLEAQVKLLTTVRDPWWKRLFTRKGHS